MVPLRHQLAVGDTVEVIANPSQVPRKDWLDFVVTGKARSRIRHAVRAEEKDRSRQLGREIVERELRKSGISLARAIEAGDLDGVAKKHGSGSVDTLLAAVGYGRVHAADIARALRGEEPPQAPRQRGIFRRQKQASPGIRVSGHSDVLVRFARCCVPIPGDDVMGFVTRGRGVTVHQKDCSKAFELDPARRIEVEWEPEADAPRRIRMRVRSEDTPGLLASITKRIAARGINIGAARVTTTRDHRAELTFDVWVSDVATLNSVMKEIGRVKGVRTVERLRT
jgi:GTP pyrophosphokinase